MKQLKQYLLISIAAFLVFPAPSAAALSYTSPANTGSIYAFGDNDDGVLGTGSPDEAHPTPAKIPLPEGAIPKKFFATEMFLDDMRFVVTTDGRVFGWGLNYGGLGDGTFNDATAPVEFLLPADEFAVDVYSTRSATYVLTQDGDVYGTGYNANGELGLGPTTDVFTPVKLPLPAGAVASKIYLSSYYDHGFIITTDGRVFGSGNNAYGQLGDGTAISDRTFVQMQLPVGAQAVDVVASGWTTTVLLADGRVFVTGANDSGQLGDGTTNGTLVPIEFPLPVGVNAAEIIIAHEPSSATIVLGDDKQLYVSGFNGDGELGTGDTSNVLSPVRYDLPAGVGVEQVALGRSGDNTVVLTDDGRVFGSGGNARGQIGIGVTGPDILVPTQMQLPVDFYATKISAEMIYAEPILVMSDDGRVYGVGSNYGSLGNGSSAPITSTPVQYQLPAGAVAQDIYINYNAGYVLTTDGRLFAAGANSYGQLGDTTLVDSNVPVQVAMPPEETITGFTGIWDGVYVFVLGDEVVAPPPDTTPPTDSDDPDAPVVAPSPNDGSEPSTTDDSSDGTDLAETGVSIWLMLMAALSGIMIPSAWLLHRRYRF